MVLARRKNKRRQSGDWRRFSGDLGRRSGGRGTRLRRQVNGSRIARFRTAARLARRWRSGCLGARLLLLRPCGLLALGLGRALADGGRRLGHGRRGRLRWAAGRCGTSLTGAGGRFGLAGAGLLRTADLTDRPVFLGRGRAKDLAQAIKGASLVAGLQEVVLPLHD